MLLYNNSEAEKPPLLSIHQKNSEKAWTKKLEEKLQVSKQSGIQRDTPNQKAVTKFVRVNKQNIHEWKKEKPESKAGRAHVQAKRNRPSWRD